MCVCVCESMREDVLTGRPQTLQNGQRHADGGGREDGIAVLMLRLRPPFAAIATDHQHIAAIAATTAAADTQVIATDTTMCILHLAQIGEVNALKKSRSHLVVD